MKKRSVQSAADRKKLLVCFDIRHVAAQRMIGGIMRFAVTHPGWDVQLAQAHPSERPLADFASWRPDALIADSSCQDLPRETFARLFRSAVVYVTVPPRRDVRTIAATLRPDERALATAATDLFLRHRLSNFAFVATGGSETWNEARERLFRAALVSRGYALRVIRLSSVGDWRKTERTLTDALCALPKPCGIWAAHDLLAKHVLDAARNAEISVPGQLQVLGVDDEPIVCEYTSPSLSSVAPDFESGGYQAFEFLDKVVVQGIKPAKRLTALKFGTRGVVERISTADPNGVSRHVAEAREFIRRNAATDIGVPDVAAAVRISRRLLERNFRDATGRTVLEFIQDERLARVTKMLKETRTPVADIARLCGFPSPTHLMTLFRHRYGETMTTYRNGFLYQQKPERKGTSR